MPDVDHVLTTQELGRMIEEAGLRFKTLQPESLDMPMGFKTGAGVIFGSTGGVTEAVLRYAVEKANGVQLTSVDFEETRGMEAIREAVVTLNGRRLKVGIVHGLANAQKLVEQVKQGKCDYHLIEVMSCPGGCIGGAGQPVSSEPNVREMRAKGLYDTDKTLQLHKSQDNYMVRECYETCLGEIGGPKAHGLLHTRYQSRRRLKGTSLSLHDGVSEAEKLEVNVCVGTSCFVRGSQELLHLLGEHIESEGLQDTVDLKATFCFERCGRGPTVSVGEHVIEKCTFEKAHEAIQRELKNFAGAAQPASAVSS